MNSIGRNQRLEFEEPLLVGHEPAHQTLRHPGREVEALLERRWSRAHRRCQRRTVGSVGSDQLVQDISGHARASEHRRQSFAVVLLLPFELDPQPYAPAKPLADGVRPFAPQLMLLQPPASEIVEQPTAFVRQLAPLILQTIELRQQRA